jgi:uncharacterized small protein (DUF1192 family)
MSRKHTDAWTRRSSSNKTQETELELELGKQTRLLEIQSEINTLNNRIPTLNVEISRLKALIKNKNTETKKSRRF